MVGASWALRLKILSLGRSTAKDPFLPLVMQYQQRLQHPGCDLIELPAASGLGAARLTQEAAKIQAKCTPTHRRLILDERGQNLTSPALAKLLQDWQDAGARGVDVIIGGDQGLDEDLRRSGDALLAFGQATWPHKLVRVMVLEQLYRARQLILGHPYHHG